MITKKTLITFALILISSCMYSTTTRDSIHIDPRWNVWAPDVISNDGKWILIAQQYINNPKDNKRFVVNTATRNKIELTKVENPSLIEEDRLIALENKQLVIIDLHHPTNRLKFGEVEKFEVLKNKPRVLLLEKGTLKIVALDFKTPKTIWKQTEIKELLINEHQTHLLYQKKDSKTLYHLDLNSLKEVPLFDLQNDLRFVTWNEKGDAFTFIQKDHSIEWFNLNDYKHNTIPIPKAIGEIQQLKTDFFTNNDLYISYNIKPLHKNPEDDYLDIWNGNARDLHLYDRSVKYDRLKAFVYHSKDNMRTELKRNHKKEYLHIGIPNHIISYNPFEFIEYLDVYENKRYILEQISPNKVITELTQISSLEWSLNKSPNENFILYPKDSIWELYNLETKQKQFISHTHADTKPIWSSDSKKIYYQHGNNLKEYTFNSKKTKQLTDFKSPNVISIHSQIRKANSAYVDTKVPLIFTITRYSNPANSIYSYHNNQLTKILDRTQKRVNTQYLSRAISKDGKTMVWTEEDYNKPPTVKIFSKGERETLLETDLPAELYDWRQQKAITYIDKYGTELTGLLYYPKNFDTTRKYPMITYIYQRVGSSRNIFDIPSFYNQNGFNQALFTELEYFVFQPDTYVTEEGPGLSALNQVTLGIEKITKKELAINTLKIGLMGHSFGGYEANFIVTQTKLFSACVSGAGIFDLLWNSYEFNAQVNRPNYSRFDHYQYELKENYFQHSNKYIKNSPILYTHQITTPILLWTGMKDYNVHWENTRHFYTALKRFKKPTISLFYKNENHTLSSLKGQNDLTRRIIDWFDYYLKDKKEIVWIKKGIYYSTY